MPYQRTTFVQLPHCFTSLKYVLVNSTNEIDSYLVFSNTLQEANFSIADADIILLSIYWPYTIHQNLNDTDPPEYLLKDAFTASFLYLKMHNFIKRIFRIVGLGKHLELIKFDGFVFHKLHQMSPLWDETERRDWMEKIEHLRLYAE